MTKFLSIAIAIALTTLSLSVVTSADELSAERLSYRRDVWPILKRHCWGCHSGTDPQGGLDVGTVAAMVRGGDSGALFEAGQPADSLLLEMIAGDEPEMPKQQPPLSSAKIDILRKWIATGAQDDSPSSAPREDVRIPATYRFAPAVTSVAISDDGQRVAAACRSEVVLIDLRGNARPRRLATTCDLISHLEYSPNGKLLAVVGGAAARYGEIRFLQAADGSLISKRRLGHDTLFRGSFAPNGQVVAVGGADGAVHLVPLDPAEKVLSFDLHSDWVLDVAYTPDGSRLVTASRDKTTKICSAKTGELLRTLDTSSELISSVATDGHFAVAAGRAKQMVGYELQIALGRVEIAGTGNSFRPVTKRSQYARDFESQPAEVLDLAISGDRKRIAVAGAYHDIRVYGMNDRKRIALIEKLPSSVYSVALNGDGARLVAGTKQGQVQVFQLPAAERIFSLYPVPVEADAQPVAARKTQNPVIMGIP